MYYFTLSTMSTSEFFQYYASLMCVSIPQEFHMAFWTVTFLLVLWLVITQITIVMHTVNNLIQVLSLSVWKHAIIFGACVKCMCSDNTCRIWLACIYLMDSRMLYSFCSERMYSFVLSVVGYAIDGVCYVKGRVSNLKIYTY